MEVHPPCATLPSLLPEDSGHTATGSHGSQQVSPSSSDLNTLFESGDAALEAFQGDATARLVLRPIAPSQKTSGAGNSPTSSYDTTPSAAAAQWQSYSYNGDKDVQMALQLQQEKEQRQAAEERANQALELARQLAMTLAAQQGLDANGMMPPQQNSAMLPQQNNNILPQQNNMMPQQSPTGGMMPQQSPLNPGLIPQQANLPPLSINQPHAAMRASYSYNDFTTQYNVQHQQLDSATATAAARYILNQTAARAAEAQDLHQLLPQQQRDWALGTMPTSHDNSPWGTPHAGTSAIDELTRQLNLIQLQQQQQQHQAHMAQLSDSALGALSLSQQLHHHAWGAAAQPPPAAGFRDTFQKPSSWSRTQRDKISRFGGKAEPRQRRRSADSDAFSIRDTLLRSAYGLMPMQPPQPRVVDMRRVFVGNIGWWVDDALLAEYFGRFGTITDMQVMWNTRQLSKGKKINREFAFISYATPEEAQRAISFMHGKCIDGLTKDSDGLTVQYEAIGSSKKKKNMG